MTGEMEFLQGIGRALGKVIVARNGRSSMSLSHAIMDAVLTFLYYQERYTEPKRGSALILKPLLLVALRDPKTIDEALADVSAAIDNRVAILHNGTMMPTTTNNSRPDAQRVPPTRIGAPTTTVLAPSVAMTGEGNV